MNSQPHLSTSHGLLPIWLINGPVDRGYIALELDEMSAKGIKEVIVGPSTGLPVEQSSDEWFEIAAWIVDEAKARKMHIWFSQELNDSSYAAGNPEMTSKYLTVKSVPTDEIDVTSFEPGQFLVAARMQGGSISKTRVLADRQSLYSLDETWHIFNCHIKRNDCCLDTLSKAAVDGFKGLILENYRWRFSSEFGKTIRGFVIDEPKSSADPEEDWVIPYTEKLFQSFEEHYGYSAVPLIPYLFYPGSEASAFRADFWEHVGTLRNTNYFGNIASWCNKNDLLYTSCCRNDGPVGDQFGSINHMDLPCISHMGKATLGNRWLSVVDQKIATSQAHINQKNSARSTSFGMMDWDTCYLDLKKVADWQFSQGINEIAPHALYHTIASDAKRDCPPSFFLQSPLWQDFDAFSDYVSRLSEFLSGGKHICHILILHPLSGLRAAYQPDRKTQEFEMVDSFLNQLCIELMNRQLDYDFVDFPTLSSAKIENKQILLGNERYDMLLVPCTPYMRPAEYEAIRKIGTEIETSFFYRTVEPTPANIPSAENAVRFVATEDLPNFVMRLRHAIDDGIHLNGIGREDIILLQREKDGKRIVFMANRSEHVRKISARFTEPASLQLIEPETGASHSIGSKLVGKKTEAVLHFGPYQSWILIAGDDSVEVSRTEGKLDEVELSNLSFETAENVALIFEFDDKETGQKIDIRKEAGDLGGVYEAKLSLEGGLESIRMVLDHDYSNCRIIINGSEVIPMPTQNWLTDPSDIAADVSSLLQDGENTIQVVSQKKLLEPVRFAGDFDVVMSEVVTIRSLGKRDMFALEKSMPFYSGTVTYTADFELSEQPERIELNLAGTRDSAAVYVNGVLAGKRLWPPYIFDLSGFVGKGKNELSIEVRNNPANLILGKHRAFGLRDEPKLHELRVVSSEQ